MATLNPRGACAPMGMTALAAAAAIAMGTLSTSALALGLLPGTAAPAPVAAAPMLAADPRVVDLGMAAPSDTKSFVVSLAVRNAAALDAFVAAVGNPASPSFRQFITPSQFAATYGQTPAAVAQVVSWLQAQGFTIDDVNANNLFVSVTGTNAQIAATFGAPVHAYSLQGATWQAPAGATAVPAAIAGIVADVAGLSDRVVYRPHHSLVPNTGALAGDVPSLATAAPAAAGGAPASGPGSYTVLDFAQKYNVNPLYAKGLTGAGKTIGIATLASYSQADAYAYWSALGLNVSQTRITDVKVGKGASAGYGPGTEGAGETTLDVEQSGGIAPGANIRVFVAPNTSSGFLQAFSNPITENKVDVLSISWGGIEIAYSAQQLAAFDTVFKQAAAQGIPIIAASADSGAFDVNANYPMPDCTSMLTVDFPAASPLVLAAGGTTLPNVTMHAHGAVTVAAERAWGWDYMHDYITANFGAAYGTGLYYSSYFGVGAGGGVSVKYALPAWQSGLAGVQKSAPGQALLCSATALGQPAGPDLLVGTLPGNFVGRNVPDVALDADPYSGYSEYFNKAWTVGGGGTSFVAPQLNGILTLITQGLPGRIGQINPQLYAAFKAKGYAADSPFKAIVAGDNEYWKSVNSYNPATGLGSLDVSALATALGVK